MVLDLHVVVKGLHGFLLSSERVNDWVCKGLSYCLTSEKVKLL